MSCRHLRGLKRCRSCIPIPSRVSTCAYSTWEHLLIKASGHEPESRLVHWQKYSSPTSRLLTSTWNSHWEMRPSKWMVGAYTVVLPPSLRPLRSNGSCCARRRFTRLFVLLIVQRRLSCASEQRCAAVVKATAEGQISLDEGDVFGDAGMK
jgi:hypothetical protein